MSWSADRPEPRDAEEITAAIERLPNSGWRHQAAVTLGLVTLAGGIASAAPNYGMPSLANAFGVSIAQLTSLNLANLVGQLLGALWFGWIAGRHGRIPALLGATALFGLMSLLCGIAWNLPALVVFRGLQGVGLAGEATVAATYLIEILGARDRGHVLLFYQISLPLGALLATFLGSAIISGGLGWQPLFLLGALPLASLLYLWRLLPESPLWLATRGRTAEAFKELASIAGAEPATLGPSAPSATAREPVDEPAPVQEINYAGRIILVSAIWLVATIVNFAWLSLAPGLYVAAYNAQLPGILGTYAFSLSVCGLIGMVFCARRIDQWGRRRWFVTSFAVAAAVFAVAAAGLPISAPMLFICVVAAYFFTATFSVTLYLYVLELFPTRARPLALGGVIAWTRLIALLVPYGLTWVVVRSTPTYLAMALLAAAGATIAARFAIETKGRPLHQIAPD
jgi:MFS transporter, putative metabolite:H+ symporter